jgi:hypothetical protein
MVITKKIDFPTYNCKLSIQIVDNVKQSVTKLYKKYKIKMEDNEEEFEGCVVSPDFTVYHLFLGKDYVTHNTIAHEIFHVAKAITEDRGIMEEEAQAWLTGHITGELYKFLEKKKIEVKHE